MIVEGLFNLLVGLVELVIGLFPSITVPSVSTGLTVKLLSWGLYFFPLDLWVLVIGNIVFWLSIQFIWACVEWVYKKFPSMS